MTAIRPAVRRARSRGRRSSRIATALAAAALLAAVAGCSDSGSDDDAKSPSAPPSSPGATAPGQPGAAVGRYQTPNPGSVNTFWFEAPQGLVLVDTLRTTTDAQHALPQIRATGKPVVAILLTHSHPDHVGGAGVFHEAYPQAPIFASTATAAMMREDPLGFYALTRTIDKDFPQQVTLPDHTFEPGAAIEVGGTRLETAEFAEGESATATAYYDPATLSLYAGDLVGNHVTPALLEGHSCGWLTNLGKLHDRFPNAATAFPGHGAPGAARQLLDEQRVYLQKFRALVRAAMQPATPSGAAVDEAESGTIVAEMERMYPGYPSVASLPTLVQENVKGVAGELGKEPAPAALPEPCRPDA
ncbi:MAG: MBL fold metallo-hydrolase [Streptomycetaceae bacterium]|nr:MBL fold metallo-hydrolase [Streptomycetaceae bacterium]